MGGIFQMCKNKKMSWKRFLVTIKPSFLLLSVVRDTHPQHSGMQKEETKGT